MRLVNLRSPRAAWAGLAPILAALGLAFGAVPADARLAAVGPVDPATGAPASYTDGTGLVLRTCVTAAFCVAPAAGDPVFPATGSEINYWSASAQMPVGAGGLARLDMSVGAAGPAVGAPLTTASTIGVRATGLTPNANYSIVEPYGT